MIEVTTSSTTAFGFSHLLSLSSLNRILIITYLICNMAPGILTESNGENGYHEPTANGKSEHRKPLKLSGALDGIKYEDTTPVIGREFFDVNIVDDILTSEEKLRDLAIISEWRR